MNSGSDIRLYYDPNDIIVTSRSFFSKLILILYNQKPLLYTVYCKSKYIVFSFNYRKEILLQMVAFPFASTRTTWCQKKKHQRSFTFFKIQIIY
jgi:hypothetical protein